MNKRKRKEGMKGGEEEINRGGMQEEKDKIKMG